MNQWSRNISGWIVLSKQVDVGRGWHFQEEEREYASRRRHAELEEDEINVPIALRAFRDKMQSFASS